MSDLSNSCAPCGVCVGCGVCCSAVTTCIHSPTHSLTQLVGWRWCPLTHSLTHSVPQFVPSAVRSFIRSLFVRCSFVRSFDSFVHWVFVRSIRSFIGFSSVRSFVRSSLFVEAFLCILRPFVPRVCRLSHLHSVCVACSSDAASVSRSWGQKDFLTGD